MNKRLFSTWKKKYYDWQVPTHIKNNFISLETAQLQQLRESFLQNMHPGLSFDRESVKNSYEGLEKRLEDHRNQVIPWLSSIKPLKGLKILEIGCGNGTSTVALAEQGATVTAIDIEENLLNDAISRCKVYGLNARFYLLNANEVAQHFGDERFDMVLFYAVLEHMTYAERLSAIKSTFAMLNKGGLWSVIGTPNRLYFFDSHTAMLPFYFWLPDELALKYASFSPRSEFSERFPKDSEYDKEQYLEFMRWGRGISYHELELALNPMQPLTVVSSLQDFLKKRDVVYRFFFQFTENYKYNRFLKRFAPHIDSAFFYSYLDLVLEKNN